MKYKVEISVMIAAFLVLSLSGVASADSVKKTLYVDGNNMGEATATLALSFPYPRLTIGSEGNRYYRYNGLVGQIDEFAVYDSVLTHADVNAHFNAGAGGYEDAVLASNPLLYLQFEDASSNQGDKAANSGSADINSTYIGAVGLTADGDGYIGKAAILHGATSGTGDCVDVCDWDQQLSKTNVSVEFWVKTTQASEYPRLFQHNGATNEQHSYGAMYSAETSAIGLIGGGSTGYITKAINDNAWHHVVVTFASIQPGPYTAEVLADDPCAYLKFENTLVVDSSVNGYVAGRGTETRVEKTAGGLGKSIFISNDIDPSANASFAYVWNNWTETPGRNRSEPPWSGNDDRYAFTASDVTIEMWFKSVSGVVPHQYGILFQQFGAWGREPNAPALGLSGNTPGTSTLRVAAGPNWWYPGVLTPLDGQWHQAVVTYDENEVNPGRDMGIQLYVDGALRASTTIVDDVNLQALLGPELSHMMIGAENDRGYAGNAWGGYVDEFAIYGGILSGERIATHFAAWQPKDCNEVWARGLGMDGDLDMDCDVDMYDYALFASQWASCNTPGGAGCIENW